MYRTATLVGLSAILIVAGTTTVAGAERPLTRPGSPTRASATPVLPGEIAHGRLLLGERSLRSQSWFVLRGRAGARAVVTVTHGGDPADRALALGVAQTARALQRVRVAAGATRTVRTRVGDDGRLLVQVGCAGPSPVARCGSPGAVRFRLRAASGPSLVRATRDDAPLPHRAPPLPSP